MTAPDVQQAGAQQAAAPRCQYCAADCSDGRSWDGGDLYACPTCSDHRAQISLLQERLRNLGDLWRQRLAVCDLAGAAPFRAGLRQHVRVDRDLAAALDALLVGDPR
jgi:hypothetical protein